MDDSKIAWTESTFNPWIGCTKVSDGCKNCYAEALMDHRFHKAKWGPQGKRVKTSAAYWKKPLQWNKERFVECDECGWRGHNKGEWNLCGECGGYLRDTRRRVFCASLADVFEDNQQVANWRGELFRLIEQAPNLDWLILTKRPDKIFSLGTDAVGDVFDNWMGRHPNVWLGTSVESQEHFNWRVSALLNVYAKVHFLSVEPMTGSVRLPKEWSGLVSMRQLNWVICGGESGKGCRPMELEWARDLRDDCVERGIRFFMKQLGGEKDHRDRLRDFPDDLQVREFPTPPLAPPQMSTFGEGRN